MAAPLRFGNATDLPREVQSLSWFIVIGSIVFVP